MNMIESIKTCFSKYATFNGRAIRSEFWWFALFTFIVSNVLGFIAMGSMMSGMDLNNPEAMPSFAFGPLVIIAMLVNIALIIPSLAVGCRRLHDTGKSGWWQLLWLLALVPFVGIFIALIVLAYFWAQPGNEKGDKYGS